MGRPETTTRLVLLVRHDAEDGSPFTAGEGYTIPPRPGLVLAAWLAGCEVRVADVGPALGPQEMERGPALIRLLRSIGSTLDAIARHPEPRDGRRWTRDHGERRGRLNGLLDAYAILTGINRGYAEQLGKEAWEKRERWPDEVEGGAL